MTSVLSVAAVAVVIIGVVLLLVIPIGAGMALFDLGGRREEEAQWLQTRVARRLERDSRFNTATILPVVHVPAWERSSLIVEVHGRVPSQVVRRGLLEAVADEIERSRPGHDFALDDHLRVEERKIPAA